MVMKAVVCVSGGMDSTAAAIWAWRHYSEIVLFSARYGQLNADNELPRAEALRRHLGEVKLMHVPLCEALSRTGLRAGAVSGHDGRGNSRAIVAGRNPLLITSAASHAAAMWDDSFDVVMGCNADDAAAFPDCTAAALNAVGQALSLCMSRQIRVVAPFVDQTKAQLLSGNAGIGTTRWAPEDVRLLQLTWSCYAESGPCGVCSACEKRAEAFRAAGLEDLSRPASWRGGDPGRDARLKR